MTLTDPDRILIEIDFFVFSLAFLKMFDNLTVFLLHTHSKQHKFFTHEKKTPAKSNELAFKLLSKFIAIKSSFIFTNVHFNWIKIIYTFCRHIRIFMYVLSSMDRPVALHP